MTLRDNIETKKQNQEKERARQVHAEHADQARIDSKGRAICLECGIWYQVRSPTNYRREGA